MKIITNKQLEQICAQMYGEGFKKGTELGYNIGLKIGRGERFLTDCPSRVQIEADQILEEKWE